MKFYIGSKFKMENETVNAMKFTHFEMFREFKNEASWQAKLTLYYSHTYICSAHSPE